tara:strand:- start:136 stop:600 length:465 start_codon:yes stop_codon:yes gene_type:complete
MTKTLDNMIQSELDNYYLDSEGDYISEFDTFLPDSYAGNQARWHEAIKAAVGDSVKLSDNDLEAIVDEMCQWGNLYIREIRYTMSYRRDKDFEAFEIGELEIQLPDDLDSYESDEFHIQKMGNTHFAYALCDEVITYSVDKEEVIEFLKSKQAE